MNDQSNTANRELIKKASSSVFNYWFGYVANVSLVIWLSTRSLDRLNPELSRVEWFSCIFGGLFLWTFLEYVLHKFAYHVLRSPIQVGHDMHHDEPRALMGVPWYLTTIAIIVIYYALSFAINPSRTAIVMASTWAGYIWYCFMHHAVHHFAWKNNWFVEARKHHAIHHARGDFNWGITTDLWDRLFRTKV